MKCPHCYKFITKNQLAKKKLGITREEWAKLKKGSILISGNGTLRTIIDRSRHMVALWKISKPESRTAYLYTDICWIYKVKKF